MPKDIWYHVEIPNKVEKDDRGRPVYLICKYCDTPITGRAERVPNHLNNCVKYQEFQRNQQDRKNPQKSNILESSVQAATQEARDKQWLRVLIANDLPLHITESIHVTRLFRLFTNSYTPPSRYKLGTTVVNSLYKENRRDLQTFLNGSLDSGKRFTLQVDGWTSIAHRNLFGILLHRPGIFPIPVDIKDISDRPHTSERLMETIVDSMKAWNGSDAPFNGVDALTTDNPSCMKKLRELIVAATSSGKSQEEELSPIVVLPCFAHGLNLLTKGFLSHERAAAVVSKSSRIVNFFRGSTKWKSKLDQIKQVSFKTYSETRWYTSMHALRGVQSAEPALRQLLTEHSPQGRSTLPDDLVRIIEDPSFFRELDIVISFLKPIGDSLGRIEGRNVTLAQCALEMLRISSSLRNALSRKEQSSDLKTHLFKCFNARFDEYFSDYHVLALLLHPDAKYLVISDDSLLKRAHKQFEHLLKKWSYCKTDAWACNDQLRHYVRGGSGFVSPGATDKPLQWWEGVPKAPSYAHLRQFAVRFLRICPTSVEVERVFSSLSCISTKKRNRMSSTLLQQISLIKMNLKSEASNAADGNGVKRRKLSTGDSSSTGRVDGSPTVGDHYDDQSDFPREAVDEGPNDESLQEGEDEGPTEGPVESVLDDSSMLCFELSQSTDEGSMLRPQKYFNLDDPVISMREPADEEEDTYTEATSASAP